MNALTLRVDVPICGLRPYEARDYQETLPAPPPATVFGMLLSLAGIPAEERSNYIGNRLGIAIGEEPPVSTVLRQMRRSGNPPEFRPEYQELLSGLEFWVAVERDADATHQLAEGAETALTDPASIDRFGGLSLGESAFLVDAVEIVDDPPDESLVLRPTDDGIFTMPVWTNFSDRSRTRLRRFDLVEGRLGPDNLVEIGPHEEI